MEEVFYHMLYRGLYRGYIGIMEMKMETTIWGLGSKLLKGELYEGLYKGLL